ncbi:MAG: hypothetical protein KAT90_15415 [Gammaproteobacteria bacterium]|nr:hypothetical protein [Gammaproteobacteria bacterium]
MSWAAKLDKLVTKGGHDLGELSMAIKIEMFSAVVEGTRVLTGRLKGNWQIQEGRAATGALDRLDPNGSKVNSEINSGSTESGKTYFTNNLPYAKKFEEEDAMVATAVATTKQGVDAMIRAIK